MIVAKGTTCGPEPSERLDSLVALVSIFVGELPTNVIFKRNIQKIQICLILLSDYITLTSTLNNNWPYIKINHLPQKLNICCVVSYMYCFEF